MHSDLCGQLQLGDWLTNRLESGNIKLDNSFNNGVKVKGSNKVLCLMHMCMCVLHEMSPISLSDLCISEAH